MPVIGFLDARSLTRYADRLRAFRQGLNETGYVEGENVAIEYRWAENQIDRLPALAAELVRRQVAVIAATGGHRAALAAKAATTTIPIVFVVNDDPVRLGLVASLARPGGNVTGINFLTCRVDGEAAGTAARARAQSGSRGRARQSGRRPRSPRPRERRGSGRRAMGLQIQVLNASTSREIDAAFATLCARAARRLFVGTDPFSTSDGFNGHWRRAMRSPRPIRSRQYAEAGGLMSYGPNICGCVASGRRLRRPHPQGREARGPAGGAVDQVRVGHQRPDRQDARPRRAADAARPRRRGDRVRRREFISLLAVRRPRGRSRSAGDADLLHTASRRPFAQFSQRRSVNLG